MKNKLFGLALAGAMLVATPFTALAENRGGGGHFGGGHSYSEGARGSRGGGEHFNGGHYGGRDFDRGYRDRDGHYRGSRGGVYFGYSAPYSYGYTAPNPCGYYDAAGYWHADPACYGPAAVY
jgi:hypothetical protein